jgi:PilX N-terminal
MRQRVTRGSGEEGIALIIALMAVLLLSALGFALVMTTSTETMIATNYRNGNEGLYAADAVLERAMDDLLTVPDWNKLLDGSLRSAFVDGAPSGLRTLADGSTITLDEVLNMANCGKVSTCSASDLTGNATGDRPWGTNNPVWQLYAYGAINDLLPTGTLNSPFYVVVLVADDPSENDGLPGVDGVTPCAPAQDPSGGACNPGSGVMGLRAEAFGPRGAHKVIEVTVARTDTTELERGYTGQRGQDEQNRRARKAPVQSPGKKLDSQHMALTTGGIIQ